MKISHMISGSFLLGISLMGGALYVSTHSLNKTTQSLEKLSLVDQVRLSAFEDMYAEGLQTGQALRNVLINPGDEKARTNLKVSNKAFEAKLAQAFISTYDPSTTAVLNDLQTNWIKDEAGKRQVLALIDSNQKEAAADYIRNTETPDWRLVRSALLTQIAKERTAKATEVKGVIKAGRSASYNALILSSVGFVIGFLLMIYSLVNLHRRLKLADDIIYEIGERGNLKVDIPLDQKDEISKLLNRLSTTRNRLTLIVNGVDEWSSGLMDGEISKDKANNIALNLRSLINMFTR